MIKFSFFGLYFLRIKKIKCHIFFCVALVSFFACAAQAATYDLTSGGRPTCSGGGWTVSGTTYTCNSSGSVTLANGDILTANTSITIVANGGFTLGRGSTIGTSTNRISLQTTSGAFQMTASGSGNTVIYGNLNSTSSGAVTLANVSVTGTITGGTINLTGGGVTGLVTSTNSTITTSATDLSGGATAHTGQNITGGSLSGSFTMTSNNPATFTNVVLSSGSISGASTVNITGSTLGSSSSSISITSNSGAVSLSSSTVYGSLTAPSYSTINVPSGSAVYGTCSPNSTPANACNSSPPTCTTGFIGGIIGSYFNNKTLTGSATGTRVDTSINFDWGTAAPGVSTVGADNYSVRWSGSIRAPVTGAYIFQTISDDGVRLWVNGQQLINNWTDHGSTTNNSSSIVLTSGQSYTIVMEYYESGGSAIAKLNWLVPGYGTYAAISTQTASNPNTGSYCPISSQTCSGGGLLGGASGKYFNNTNLTGTAAATRIDTAIDFNWDAAAPGVTGVGADNFSVRWDGYFKVPTTGNYQFETVSDDGVRLWINNQLVIDNWTNHSQTSDTTNNIALTAGSSYPVRVEYFEAGGVSTIALHWKTPTDTSYVSIPTCPSAVAYYGISHSGTGITCAGEPITVTAYDGLGAPVAPTVGSQITLSTSPTTGVWVGGNTYSFNGGETAVVKYLQQTTASTLNINVTDGLYSESSGLDPSISFVNSALKFYGDSGATTNIQNQIAGTVTGSTPANTPVLRAIRTDTTTGACVAQVTGTKAVSFAYECNNPTSCITGQTLTVNGSGIKSNNNGTTITYSPTQNLTFDSNGTANIPLNYSDVGQVTLYAQMTLPATTNDPQKLLSGVSTSFVVRPHTLAVSAAKTSADVANLGTTNSGLGFVAAGENFKVFVEVRNSAGNLTPNFGNENTSERTKLTIAFNSLVYPTGGANTPLSNAGSFSSTTPAGTFVNTGISWNQVGSITLLPGWSGTGYQGTTAPSNMIVSGTIGRFYPDHYRLVSGSLTSACTGFTYMNQPMNMSYTLQAEALNGTTALVNYDNTNQTQFYAPTLVIGANMARASYQAETGDLGNGGALDARVVAPSAQWDNGVYSVSSTAVFTRLATPDGPLPNVQIGVGLNDTFDGRLLQATNMNSATAPVCTGTGCTAVTLGSPFLFRYGRLRLDDAFGPETVPLPVNFYTEYWIGNHFTLNAQDSCTVVPRAAITYPSGTLASDANRTVPLTGGSTQGSYNNLDATGVWFNAGVAGQVFSAPTASAQGKFVVSIDLTNLPWLRFDWNQDGNYSDLKLPNANFEFGSYRGNDRIIYWREKLQ